MGPAVSMKGRSLGDDFIIKDGWRMYHGKKVPDFPGHPHRGFETITVVRDGLVDHADSLGASGRYGEGDVQWMTAGKGVQHFEMFPLLKKEEENPMELFQIWLNLPKKNKMVEPHFKMLWGSKIPKLKHTDSAGKTTEVEARILVLQGRPIGETVIQYGPFVMNTKEEIQQAFEDYHATKFGGWPWNRYDQVHDRAEGRFARHADGTVELGA